MTLLNITDLLVSKIHDRNFESLAASRHLSKGVRLEYGADDPSGIAQLTNMKAEERGIIASIENVAETISMVDVMDAALATSQDMLFRIRDLAVRASNEAVLNGCPDRSKIQKEIDSLVDEINRQAKTTMFAGKKVLSGDYLLNIEADMSTSQMLYTKDASSPSWVDNSTVLFTAAADTTGEQSGARPGLAGTTTDRVFTRAINDDNTTAGPVLQLTDDPTILYDNDGDLYFDNGSSGINDPQNGMGTPNELYPVGDADNDIGGADGYPITADNDDTDNTETGLNLVLASDYNFTILNTVNSQDYTIIDPAWVNTIEKSFADTNVNSITVNVGAGLTYDVQVYDTGTSAWVDVASGQTGTGADETFDAFGEITASGARVILDDDVVKVVDGGNASVVDISNVDVINVVAPATGTDNPPPYTYYYNAGAAQDVDTIEINVTAGVNFDVYADNGIGLMQILSGETGDGTLQNFATFGTFSGATGFYVELDAAGVVTAFDPYLDELKGLSGKTADTPPVTYGYDVSGGDVNTIDLQVTNGVNYDIYYDNGGGPTYVTTKTGDGTLQSWNVGALVNPNQIYVELDAAGTVSNFDARNITTVALPAPTASEPPYVEKYTVNAGPQNIDYLEITATQDYDLYIDGNPFGGGLAGGPTAFAFAATNASEITIEMAAAGVVGPVDAKNGGALGVAVPLTDAGSEPRVFDYNFAAADVSHIEIEVSAGEGYQVTVGGTVVEAAGVGGALQTYDFTKESGATQITVGLDPGAGQADIVNISASNIESRTITAHPDDTRFFKYDITDLDQNVTHVDLQVAAGVNYKIYDDTGGPALVTGVGTGSVVEEDLGGVVTTSKLRIELTDLGSTSADIQSFAARNETHQAMDPQADAFRYIKYDVPGPDPEVINHLDVNLSNNVSYSIYDEFGTAVYTGGIGSGALQSIDLGTPSAATTYLRLELGVGATKDDVAQFTASNQIAYADAVPDATYFTDYNGDNQNVVTYTLKNTDGLVSQEFDELEYQVKAGHDFTLDYYDDALMDWVNLVSGVGIGADTYVAGTDEIKTSQLRIQLLSGNNVDAAETDITLVTNKIDRDGDLWPDSIEDIAGSGGNPIDDSVVPFGASGGPDDDGDKVVDYPGYFDEVDDADFLASTNPYGYTWTDGSGNALDSAGGQYENAGDMVKASDIPSNIDTDKDTIPDPLDPFFDVPEFATWLDGAAAYKGGNLLFVSNRATPSTTGQRDLYMFDGAAMYSNEDGAGDVDNPALSADGTASAWESGGDIKGKFFTTNCGGTSQSSQTLVTGGFNPSWSPDQTQIAYDDGGGNILIADIKVGAAATEIYDYGISGSDPDWSPDGDTLLYIRGGSAYAYNFVTEKEYDLGLAADEVSWSPDGSRVAYASGNRVYAVTLDIEYDLQDVQVGGNNDAISRIDFSLPDARAATLGVSGINVRTQTGAEAAIDTADSAISTISEDRAAVGVVRNQLVSILEDLNMQRINAAASRSRLEDTDMAAEYTTYVASLIVKESATATTAQATNTLKAHYRDLVNSNVQDKSLGAMYRSGVW